MEGRKNRAEEKIGGRKRAGYVRGPLRVSNKHLPGLEGEA